MTSKKMFNIKCGMHGFSFQSILDSVNNMYRMGFLVLTLFNKGSTFKIPYIGSYINISDYNNLCQSKYCLLDSNRLLMAASQNASVKPCDDFKEFSLGTTVKYRALNERYDRIGFFHDIELQHYERQRKILMEDVKENDIKPLKIAKNFFQKCTNSGKIKTF